MGLKYLAFGPGPGAESPWFAALLIATLATPAGVVLGWLAPRPLDAVVALPLVLVDMWAASHRIGIAEAGSDAPIARLLLLVLGIGLTWVWYVVAARLVLWRLSKP